MNDRTAPCSDDDLSADLDGEAGADVRDRIADDPAAQARQQELAAAAALVASPVAPLADDQVDALVTGALGATVPAASRRGPAPWLVAAAVVVLVAIGLTLVWSGRDSGSDQLAGSGGDAASTAADAPATTISPELGAEALDGADASSSQADSTAESAASTTPSDAPFLGTFDDAEALRAALATSFPEAVRSEEGASGVEAPPQEAFTRCADQLAFTLDLEGDPLASGYAEVDGELVLVYEWDHESFEDGRPTTLVTAVGRDACDEVALFER